MLYVLKKNGCHCWFVLVVGSMKIKKNANVGVELYIIVPNDSVTTVSTRY
jgi:hypothetical protein